MASIFPSVPLLPKPPGIKIPEIFLSFDLIGLVYYLILENNLVIDEKIFIKKTMFKGKIGIFEIKNNKINHVLNFYKVENKEFKKIF